jgi:hypothetical protein
MGADDRRSERANVLLTATIEGPAGAAVRVRVSNLSAFGALVIGDEIPPPETAIVLHCNGLAITSWISWSDSGRAGIAFADEVDPERLTHRERPHAAIVKDTRQVSLRRPGFRGNQLSEEEQRAVEDWKRRQSDL